MKKTPFLCVMTLFLFGGTVSAGAEAIWPDGTPVVRFDKRDTAPMAAVSDWAALGDGRWPGPSFWANRLQDWRVSGGVLRCEAEGSAPCRTVHLLTHALGEEEAPFRLEVIVTMAPGSALAGWAGFLVGAGKGALDYRGAALVHGQPGTGGGLLAVVETAAEGGLAFRDMTRAGYPLVEGQQSIFAAPIRLDYHRMMLNLEGVPRGNGHYDLRLSVWAQHAVELLGAVELRDVPADRLRGNVALAAQPERGAIHQFEDFKVGGERLEAHPGRRFGPVAGTLYAVSGDTLKLSAQCLPIGRDRRAYGKAGRVPRPTVRLEARALGATDDAAWQPVGAPQVVNPPSYYALWEIEGWDASRDWETRVVCTISPGVESAYRTVVAHDPKEKPVLSTAGFTGMGVMGHTASQPEPKPGNGETVTGKWTPANVWMPFAEAVNALRDEQDVDILFFTGDQIYEGKPTPTDMSRMPFEDYLYKWLLWHWSFNPLTNHLPAVVQPDDHDVYHGNLWGWGGRACPTDNNADGGYICAPAFVNVVHRTQTGHNPGPYTKAPCLSGITNYFGALTYGGVGFAVLEDRKFKTPPAVTEPEAQEQLGPLQEQFLQEWGEDWAGQEMKIVVSQTVYAAMHVDSGGGLSKDPDCNGFPKVGRDRSVRLFRRCGALVFCGDQHLSTFARLGIEMPSDSVYQFCVPAMGNIFWRWFYPATPGMDRKPGEAAHLGEFKDPWGNYFRMIAVANPEERDVLEKDGSIRHRWVVPDGDGFRQHGRTCQGDGYGIIRVNKETRTVTVACWPYDAQPSRGDTPYTGWPVELSFDALDGRVPVAWLPELRFEGCARPLVKIIREDTGEAVSIRRVAGPAYQPGVFDAGTTYTIEVSRDGHAPAWRAEHLSASAAEGAERQVVAMP